MYYLNGTGSGYLSTVPSTWRTLIDLDYAWHITGMAISTLENAKTTYIAEIANTTASWNGAVGLMYVSDFGYSSSPNKWSLSLVRSNNGSAYDYRSAANVDWINDGQNQWPISPLLGSSEEVHSFDVDHVVGPWGSTVHTAWCYRRPTFYLESTVELNTIVSGMDGSASHPYMLSIS